MGYDTLQVGISDANLDAVSATPARNKKTGKHVIAEDWRRHCWQQPGRQSIHQPQQYGSTRNSSEQPSSLAAEPQQLVSDPHGTCTRFPTPLIVPMLPGLHLYLDLRSVQRPSTLDAIQAS